MLNYFVEKYQPTPDTWARDIYGWNDTEIDLTVSITAYDRPLSGHPHSAHRKLRARYWTGSPLRYRDPNTARVVEGTNSAFVDGRQIAKPARPLPSNTVPAPSPSPAGNRLQYGPPLMPGTLDAEARSTRLPLEAAATERYARRGRRREHKLSFFERQISLCGEGSRQIRVTAVVVFHPRQ